MSSYTYNVAQERGNFDTAWTNYKTKYYIADGNSEAYYRFFPLSLDHYSKYASYGLVRYLLENCKSYLGQRNLDTAIVKACSPTSGSIDEREAEEARRLTIVRLLIEHHANIKPISGTTPLLEAARSGHWTIVRELLATLGKDPHISYTNSAGDSAFSWAVQNGAPEDIIKALINPRGISSLQLTTTPGRDIDGVNRRLWLIAKGANMNKGSLNHKTFFKTFTVNQQDNFVADLLLIPRHKGSSFEGFKKIVTKEEALLALRRLAKGTDAEREKVRNIIADVRNYWHLDNAQSVSYCFASDFFSRQRGLAVCSPRAVGSALYQAVHLLEDLLIPTTSPSAPPASRASLAFGSGPARASAPALPNDKAAALSH